MSIEQHDRPAPDEAGPKTPLSLVKPDPAPDTSSPPAPRWEAVTAAAHRGAALARMRGPWLFHQGVHGLKALLKLAFVYSWRGLARLVARLARWVYDMDSADLRHMHAGDRDSGEYARVHMVRRSNLHARMLVFGTCAALLVGPILAWTFPYVLSAIAGAVVTFWTIKVIPGRSPWEIVAALAAGIATWYFLPQALTLLPRPPVWVWPIALAVALVVFGLVGRPTDKPILKQTVLPPHIIPPLTAPVVTEALCELGNSKMKETHQIRLLSDPVRCGEGYQLDLELPRGVPASWVIQRREQFASGIRRELGCVFLSVGPRHPSHLVVYVSDQPMAKQDQEPWPLLKVDKVDIFRPVPVFTNQRGEWVALTFAYSSMVVGALPRMGKTFLLREALLIHAMDPRCRVCALDGKGTGDLAALQLVAHFYSRGAKPEEIERVRAMVRELRAELIRRSDIIDSLPREECPESKVTSQLADRRRDLCPIVVGIDETQSYFEYGDASNKEHKKIRQELADGITELVKLGPALGIIVLLGSQNVTATTIPRSISTNAAVRACAKVQDQVSNDQILGTSSYSQGIDATQLDLDDKGIFWLRADGARAQLVRSVMGLDAVVAEKVAARARAMRDGKGMLTGDAAGEQDGQVFQPELLDDVRDVMDSPEHGGRNISLAGLVERLGLLRPGIWGHLDNESIGGLLRNAGVKPDSIWCPAEGRSMQGIKREWVPDPEDEDDDEDLSGAS